MELFKQLLPRKVKALSTKFYYKNNRLCFQITLQYGEENISLYKDFDDYAKYKIGHDELVKAINKNKPIWNDFLAA